MDQDKDSLISEVKLCVQGKQNKEFIHYFLLAGRCLASSLRSKASAHAVITWENKCHDHEDPHFLHLFPKLLLLTIVPCGMKHSFGQFRSVVLVSSPPSFLWTPHFTCCTGWVGTKHPQREGKPRCCASTAHKLTRHWCVTSTVLITNPIHMKEIDFITARAITPPPNFTKEHYYYLMVGCLTVSSYESRKKNAGHGMLSFWIVNDFREKIAFRYGSNVCMAVSRGTILDRSRIHIEKVLCQE